MARILFAGASFDLYLLSGFIDALKGTGHEVVMASDCQSVEKILVAGEVDLAIIYGGPLEAVPPVPVWYKHTDGGCRAGFYAVTAAREKGSKTPVIFVMTAFAPPTVDNSTVICSSAFLPSVFLREIQVLLRRGGR